MKKTGLFKATGAALLLAAVIGFVSCNNGSKDDSENNGDSPSYVEMTDQFQTYYLNIADADLGGLEGFHLKNLNTDKSVGVVIDKIFASDSMSEDGAVAVFNFDAPETGTNYWGFEAGTKADGVWSSGEIQAVPDGDAEVYITGFATSVFVEHTYVGIKAKNFSADVKGDDVSLIPIIGNPVEDKAITFRAFVTK